ncbi:sialate O-acetylesterase [soil metagenome]
MGKVLVGLLGVLLLGPFVASADVVLPPVISDHMVLQKSAETSVWGKAEPGEEISVTLGTAKAKAKAGADGKWRAVLNLKEVEAGPFEMTVKGHNEVKVQDVVVGEVWLAAGQSNMQFVLKDALGAKEEIEKSSNPMLRHFKIELVASLDPQEEAKGQWVVAGPQTAADFTAVGYYFGKTLQKALKVPVGLLNATWGGTQVESWTSVEALSTVPELKESVESQQVAAREYPAKKEAFVTQYEAWLKATNREDKPPGDVTSYTGASIEAKDWTPVKLPGEVAPAGATWLRKEVVVAAKDANHGILVMLGDMAGFESAYWNGKLISELTYKDFPGAPYPRRYEIPPEQVKAGANVLAIRVYSPSEPVKFAGKVLKAGTQSLLGEWLMKTEYTLPALAKGAAPPPDFPPAPRMTQAVGGALFNGMIAPIVPCTIRGVVWYQGEGNASRAVQYRTAFPLLIKDWRGRWKQPELPFYFCQLANYMPKKAQPDDSRWAELREAQAMTLKLPHTGLASLIELGESEAIHPLNKEIAGERLAAIALATDYHFDQPYSGPVFDTMKIEGGKCRVTFKHTEGGLVAKPLDPTYNVFLQNGKTAPLVRNSPNSEIEGFAICGEDKKWVWADAKIDGSTVVVSSSAVSNPVAIRYGWADNPTVNLYNGAGFPATPFRTDDFSELTKSRKY